MNTTCSQLLDMIDQLCHGRRPSLPGYPSMRPGGSGLLSLCHKRTSKCNERLSGKLRPPDGRSGQLK